MAFQNSFMCEKREIETISEFEDNTEAALFSRIKLEIMVVSGFALTVHYFLSNSDIYFLYNSYNYISDNYMCVLRDSVLQLPVK